MAKNTLTFDPSSGVAYGVNLTLNTGADLDADYTVVGTSGTAFDFTGYTGSAQLAKSVAIGSSAHAIKTFEVGFTSLGIQIWCIRHNINVCHIDFEDNQLSADFRCLEFDNSN